MRTIAIDFDGVIHRYSKGYHDGSCYDEPMEGVEDALRYLLRDYAVFVLSTRDPHDIQKWFEQHLPQFETRLIPKAGTIFWDKQGIIGITNRKLPAVAYIDDRGIRFTNWRDIKNYF